MLPSKSKKTNLVLTNFLHMQFKRSFYRIYVSDLRKHKRQGPVLYLMNHSSWWDGLVIYYLNDQWIKDDSYALMSKKGIEEFPFFSKIGAIAVDPGSPKSLIQSLKVCEEVLTRQKSLWIFPQGKEEHLEKRPFSYMSGPAYLLGKCPDARIVHVSAYYTYRHDQRPELFIQLSEEESASNYSGSKKDVTHQLRQTMEDRVDELKGRIINEELGHFRLWKKGYRTSSEWLKLLTLQGDRT